MTQPANPAEVQKSETIHPVLRCNYSASILPLILMRRYSIQNKIVLPFILLFAVVVLIVPFITIALFDRKYDEQVSRETQEWLEAIVETGFIHQPEKVKEAYGAEVTVVGNDNTVNYTTLSGDWTNFADEMKLDEVRKHIKESDLDFVSQNVIVDGRHYKVIYYRQASDRLYCLMRDIDKIADAKRDVTLLICGIAAVVILLVALISYLIGRNLTNPIKDLVQFTRKVAGGDLNEQREVKTHDEIGDLTLAFNQMTRDLRNSRNELISAERLATAGKNGSIVCPRDPESTLINADASADANAERRSLRSKAKTVDAVYP